MVEPPSYLWYQDMRMLEAGNYQVFNLDEGSVPPDNEAKGYKPRTNEPRWVLLAAVGIMLMVILMAAVVIIGAIKATP